jgi:ectoine hydroxylase-related dioxygenase (phytanoyl-CoA dioxygenase family)
MSTKADATRSEKSMAKKETNTWISRFAVFGESVWALSFSFLLLLIAVGISFWLDTPGNSTSDPYDALGPVPSIDPPHIYHVPTDVAFTDEIMAAYKRDGVVAVRGLIGPELLKRLDLESSDFLDEQRQKNQGRKRSGTQFHTVYHGAIFRNTPNASDIHGLTNPTLSPFLDLSLTSRVPQLAAKLLGIESDGNNETMRVMRDIFLAKDDDQYICGWHVDDLGFWPATPSAKGVNAWVALDDMEVDQGGGFALSVGSHQAAWRDEAHYVTGASTTFPDEGYQSAADLIIKRTGNGTCNLKTSAPHLHRRMEETKRIYAVKRGDVIFHERWLFHRTVPFDRAFVAEHKEDELIYRRYSIRYGPGSATIHPGYGTELSVLWDEQNGGRTADEVSRLDGPWYPQAWPTASERELQELRGLVESKMPIAEQRQIERKKEMRPFLKKLARNKQGRPKR